MEPNLSRIVYSIEEIETRKTYRFSIALCVYDLHPGAHCNIKIPRTRRQEVICCNLALTSLHCMSVRICSKLYEIDVVNCVNSLKTY